MDGFRIERGTNLIVGIYAIHRDRAPWDAPETFDADRFSAERSRGSDRWQFLPFGAGPRSCLGGRFAMLEATLASRAWYDAAGSPRSTGLSLALPFTMTAGGPIPARVGLAEFRRPRAESRPPWATSLRFTATSGRRRQGRRPCPRPPVSRPAPPRHRPAP